MQGSAFGLRNLEPVELAARGELAFPGIGRSGVATGLSEMKRVAELERKIGQLTMENDFLKKESLAAFQDLHSRAVVNGEAACLRRSRRYPKM
jgi:hypothetical protein